MYKNLDSYTNEVYIIFIDHSIVRDVFEISEIKQSKGAAWRSSPLSKG